MRDKLLVRLIFACAMLSGPALADTIFMWDGSTIEGEIISDDGLVVVVKMRAGKATIAKIEIKDIQKKAVLDTAVTVVREKMSELRKNDDKNIATWLQLGVEAKAAGSYTEMSAAFERVLALDPENSSARTELGYIQRDGLWVKGVFFSEIEKRTPTLPVTPNIQLTDRERLKAIACVGTFSNANEKLADCPRCHGSGSIMTFDCTTCARSSKPGFKILVDGSYVACERCHGTRKVAGAYCSLCDRTGKVYMSQIAPWDGGAKKAPEGFAWCQKCNGAGIEAYQDCVRCKGSQWPGYIMRGGYAARCDPCAGKGKIPLTQCAHCSGKGLVPANPPVADKPESVGK
ncbi:MAG: hypothetical protein V1899_04775 [Planctomycetota bacterium]